MEENPKVTFENLESAHEFVVIFRRESSQVSDQVGDQVGDQVEPQETTEVKPLKISLTKAQKDVVNFCSVPRSAQEILSRLGLSNHSVNKKRHIQPLVDMGVLEMTNPENPNASNQKYRKVRKE